MTATTSDGEAHIEARAHVLTCAGCLAELLLTPTGILEVGSMKRGFAAPTNPPATPAHEALSPRASRYGDRNVPLMDPDLKHRPRP